MILRDKKTHYEVEMFHIVNLNHDHPREAWLDYIKELTLEFDKEITTTQYAVKLNIEPVPATTSHIIVPD